MHLEARRGLRHYWKWAREIAPPLNDPEHCLGTGLYVLPVPMDAVIGGVNATPEKLVPGTQTGSVVSREAVLGTF